MTQEQLQDWLDQQDSTNPEELSRAAFRLLMSLDDNLDIKFGSDPEKTQFEIKLNDIVVTKKL